MNDKDMEEIFAFLEAQHDAEEKGKHEFTCPICGGQAEWQRSNYNGHIRAWCKGCNFKMME